jgi:hypothetical protein
MKIAISVPLALVALSASVLAQQPPNQPSSPATSNGQQTSASQLPQGSTPATSAKPGPPAVVSNSAGSATKNTGDVDPYLDAPPMPTGEISLIGGTVKSIDRIRNRLTVEPFHAGAIKMRFDERTHIYRDGVETTMMGINKGDRVYVDSQLDKSFILARNIRVVTSAEAADARGQILAMRSGEMMMADELSSQPVVFRVDSSTVVKRRDGGGSQTDLTPGSVVAIRFAAGRHSGVAREVTVLAQPGNTFKFAGEITHLDVSRGQLAIHNRADDKTYELSFDPATTPGWQTLHVGSAVSITARFTGKDYRATDVAALPPPQQ